MCHWMVYDLSLIHIYADTLTSLLSSCALKWHSEEAVLDTQMKKAVELTNGN